MGYELQLTDASVPRLGGESVPVSVADPGGGKRPALIIVHEIFGVNEAMAAEARRWAAAGYLCVLPHLFHRLEAGVSLDYTPEAREKAFSLWRAFDLDAGVAELRAVIDWVRNSKRCTGRTALIGFCLGGQLALLAAPGSPVDAVAAFYPVKLPEYLERLAQIAVPTLIHAGSRDEHIPPEVIQSLQQGLAHNPNAEVKIYEGAQHAFYNSYRNDWYAPAAAREAHEATAALLASALQGTAKVPPSEA